MKRGLHWSCPCSDRPKWTLAHDVPVAKPNGSRSVQRFEPLCSYSCPGYLEHQEARCEGRRKVLAREGWR